MFTTFPREIAFPNARRMINTYDELLNLVNLYNCRKNLYTTVYSFSNINNSKHVIYHSAKIDKMYFDLDGSIAHEQIKMFHEYLIKKNIKHYMQFSGRGFNMFVLTKNEHLENKRIALKCSQENMLENVGIPIVKITKNNRNCEGGCDRQIIGDLARVCRLPATFNIKGKRYCLPLTDDLLYSDIDEIHKIAKKQPTGKLITYGKKLISLKKYDTKDYKINYAYNSDKKIRITDNEIDIYLPCIVNICKDECPSQYERFALVCFLSDEIRNGFPLAFINIEELEELEEKIIKFIRKLNWSNFNYSKTAYQINHIINNIENQCSCQWMMDYGICTGKCEFYEK